MQASYSSKSTGRDDDGDDSEKTEGAIFDSNVDCAVLNDPKTPTETETARADWYLWQLKRLIIAGIIDGS